MKASAVVLLFSTLTACWGTLSPPVFAQSSLERLERQIRQRVSDPDKGEADANHPPVPGAGETRRASGKAEPGYLGMVADDQKDRGRGVRVLEVQQGGPAEKAGLQRQDLITALAGVRVRQMSDMSDILSTFGPGQGVDFDVLRDGKPQKVRVVLGQRATAVQQSRESPETVPLPPGEAIPKPPEPLPPEVSHIEQLERRVDELERRVAELERELKALKKE